MNLRHRLVESLMIPYQYGRTSLVRAAAHVIFFVIALLGLASGQLHAAETKNVPVTSETVKFSGLVDIEGTPVTQIPQLGRGKWTLVMFWVTNCHICREQKPKITAFFEAHKNTDATVVGISMDGEKKLRKVRKFLAQYKVTFPNYVGDMMGVMKDYERLTNEPFQGTPTYLLFSPSGKLKGNNSGAISINALERFIDKHSTNR